MTCMYLGPYLGFAGLLPDKRPAPRSFSEVGYPNPATHVDRRYSHVLHGSSILPMSTTSLFVYTQNFAVQAPLH